ncbi:hypothetical protein [Dechloromonas denitrificans]|uniref:hypothetical protein n=1 Tax=Dechloromonas denitrificans TaxID=281362 RepID=UPI001CF8318A|nr:hypothetical protein [Dechloromonas denitrificans]UCV03027.1 hypothetical protein KI611_18415 [Dechloromonas denitrificans]UCV07344.1 hypothetical protein KI615_18400 [Dechloromonas denitrificans]
MNALAAYGLLADGLIFGAIISLLPLGPLRARAALVATAVALIGGIAPVMHGTFGTPSVTLLQLALLQLAERSPSPLSFKPALGLLIFVTLFYPAALGWGAFDPYALGYQPLALLAALIPLAAALWWRQQYSWLIILAVDLAAYATGVFANLWDVLFDPLLALLALSIVARQGVIRIIASRIR